MTLEHVQQLLNQYGLVLTDFAPNNEMLALMPTILKSSISFANVTINQEEVVLIDTSAELNEDHLIQLIQLLKNVPLPIIFLADSFSIDTQMLLTKNQFGFISQMGFYLPSLKPVKVTKPTMQLISLSKNQQIIILALIYWKLLHDDDSNTFHIKVRQLADYLNITAMTISRALRTFVDAGWLATSGYTRNHSFSIPTGYDLNSWVNEILRLLPSPVQKTLYVPINQIEQIEEKKLASLTALSKFTLIAPTTLVSWAISNNQLTDELKQANLPEFNARLTPKNNAAVEIWKYDSQVFNQLLPKNYQLAVDPVSLFLSLRNSHSKEVTEQLNKLLENLVNQH
ncbi:winged helix-turn-helix domain-containing protein [Periweissella fabaria]|uniref:helix-turn-helix domain-containing protein n=1 Tax=Periweissella fabaria TaxID=546157 RepID=UPI001E41D78A|nr:helix-turn-helix domain-containing protein [Periweissella fabaria]MCM0596922.1 winged helix-turn-helix domain-containing protein [Periweissella fabaria]